MASLTISLMKSLRAAGSLQTCVRFRSMAWACEREIRPKCVSLTRNARDFVGLLSFILVIFLAYQIIIGCNSHHDNDHNL